MSQIDIERLRQEREKRTFELGVESFCNSWAPDDPCKRSQFEAQLFSLVRQIYRDAQEPVLEQLSKMASHCSTLGMMPTK